MKALVAGGGIGGLSVRMGLHCRGVDVVVLERAEQPDTGGAALSLWPNALRGLDQLAIGGQIRRHAALGGDTGIRRPDGRWLARTRLGPVLEARFGDPPVIVHRATFAQLLVGQLPPGTVRYTTSVTGVQPGTCRIMKPAPAEGKEGGGVVAGRRTFGISSDQGIRQEQ